MSTHALVATLHFNDTVVEQRSVPRGRSVTLGRDDTLALPLPAGAPYYARCVWRSSHEVEVVDGRGRQYRLTAREPLSLDAGPVRLDLKLAPQFSLLRSGPLRALGSAVWFLIILMVTNLYTVSSILYERQCVWFGLNCPVPEESGLDGTFSAEFLQRLLREDFAGEEEGVVAKFEERPDAEKEAERVFMPAGNKGPITNMGGAEDVSAKPVRSPKSEDAIDIPEVGGDLKSLFMEDSEFTLEEKLNPKEEAGQGVDIPLDREEDPNEALDAPSEEEEGWGIQDWYDERDAMMDEIEIVTYIRAARQVLAIDPNDLYALSTLAYYQYLAEEFDDALETYDKYIALAPDQAAGYNNKALTYKRRGDYASEERLYRVALALEPDDVTAMNNLAVCLSHQGRFDEALALMQQLEVLDPGDAYADLHRSKIYAQMGQDDEAYRYLEKSLQGMSQMNTLHMIEFRQDIRVDPSFEKLRETRRFRDILYTYYGQDTPLPE